MIPLTTIATSACMAPRIEVYTLLVCSHHRPDVYREMFPRTVANIISSLVAGGSGNKSPCAADPTVQAEVAKLNTGAFISPPLHRKPRSDHCTLAISLCMGILSCLTSAWWGGLSDRIGRTKVMGICIIGLLITDTVLIIVVYLNQYLPGGYWFILTGSVIEGALGGTYQSRPSRLELGRANQYRTDHCRGRHPHLHLGHIHA